MKTVLLFLGIALYAHPISSAQPSLLIVWNVGQGSWTTVVDKTKCWHFDMGGEFSAQQQQLLGLCQRKVNVLALTHLDRDHTSFIRKYTHSLQLCLFFKKTFSLPKKWKSLADCREPTEPLRVLYSSKFKFKNESHMYLWKKLLLVTGDSYKTAEIQLSKNHLLQFPKFFLVGHHGSKTSSHPLFISQLKSISQAIVSARRHKYGHPHFTTRTTFRRYRVPLIETQNFGTLIYELN